MRMQNNLGHYRKSYESRVLTEKEVDPNPIQQFHRWFLEADAFDGITEANAMAVSTLGLDGFPKSRIVLLKHYDEQGFVFYTNYNSEKGRSILAHPQVCLSFFWPPLERQVIIQGTAQKVSSNTADHYFQSRPKGSQLGALASPQSEVISRSELEDRLKQLEKQYQHTEIPRPDHWGGFIVLPVSVEFWQGRPNRLHDRIRYRLQTDQSWKIERLAP